MLCGPSLRSSAYRQWPHARRVRRAVSALAASLWGESRVTYVRNITDVDDKINARAAELSVDIRALTNEMIAIFHADAKALGCLEPTIEPRATDHIAPLLDIIGKLDRSWSRLCGGGPRALRCSLRSRRLRFPLVTTPCGRLLAIPTRTRVDFRSDLSRGGMPKAAQVVICFRSNAQVIGCPGKRRLKRSTSPGMLSRSISSPYRAHKFAKTWAYICVTPPNVSRSRKNSSNPAGEMISRIRAGTSPAFQNVCH
jgi:hypothetical protein